MKKKQQQQISKTEEFYSNKQPEWTNERNTNGNAICLR